MSGEILSKRHLAIIASVFMIVLAVQYPVFASAAEPLNSFSLLVKNDKGLTTAEKNNWQKLMAEKLQGRSISFDYSHLIYSILSRAKFDEVDIKRGAQVALDCTLAVESGAPRDEVEELAMLAFATDIKPEEMTRYAIALQRCTIGGVPVHITQELIGHAGEMKWPAATLDRVIGGLLEAARHPVNLEKFVLYMMISVDQNLGTADKIVQDAIRDAKLREPARWKEIKTVKSLSTADEAPQSPPVALNYDQFRESVESFQGTPYVWGGATRAGSDCSGFTSLVMKENGYTIPRTSQEQAKRGTPVSKENLRLGDLLFFDTKGAGSITHVGFYLGGNLLVHAASSKGVTIILFSDKYFLSRFLTARRIIKYADR
jgi:cell wall-associated NlpC family hydrolase